MALGWMISCVVLDIAVIVANVAEEILIFKKWSNLDRIDHILLSLSISDLFSGVTTLGLDTWSITLSGSVTGNATNDQIENSKSIGKIFDGFFLFSVFASIFHIIAVAIERLYAIRFPRQYYIFTTFRIKCGTIFMIWFVAILLTPTFSTLPELSLDLATGSLFRAIFLTVTIALVFFVYLYISYLLFRQRKLMISDLHTENGIQDEKLKRLTILCCFFAISFVICVLPITLGYYHNTLYHPISNVMITLNSLVNPCVYFVKVYYDNKTLSRERSDTNNALLEPRNYAYTTTTLSHSEIMDLNFNDSEKQKDYVL